MLMENHRLNRVQDVVSQPCRQRNIPVRDVQVIDRSLNSEGDKVITYRCPHCRQVHMSPTVRAALRPPALAA